MEDTTQMILDQYKSYWKTYIQPIEEDRIRAQFNEILSNLGQKLYGLEFAFSLTFFFLKEQSPDLYPDHTGDK